MAEGGRMDEGRARELLGAERDRVTALLADATSSASANRAEANAAGPYDNAAERLTAEEGDDAIAASLQRRLAAIDRADRRLDEGTYGRSIRSGVPIGEDRLEADPAAELTAEEAGSGASL
jgi:DnaK suppressor protein